MLEFSERWNILKGNRNSEEEAETPVSLASSNDVKELIQRNDSDGMESSLESASFNYINSIIGSGVIGIPFALQEAGFGLGLVLLVFIAIVTDYSLVLMVRGGHLAGVFSYRGLMEASFGRAGYVLLSLLQFVYPFIAMISYNVVVGDTVTKVLTRMFKLEESSWLARREMSVGLATAFVTLPLCLYRDIGKLAKVSLFSLVCVGFILVAVIIKFFMLFDTVDSIEFPGWPPKSATTLLHPGLTVSRHIYGTAIWAAPSTTFHPPSSEDAWQFANWNIIPSAGIMTFAFMCHHNTFLIYGSIEKADQNRWDRVTHISLFTSFVLAALFGIAGYATFTGYSEGDLLENYCPGDDLINAARIFFSITILLTYPIECFVTREVLEDAVLGSVGGGRGILGNKHFLLTLIIVVATYLISTTTDCLGIVLELNGILAAVPLAYILPGLCYLKLDTSPLLSRKKIPAVFLVFFGSTVAFFGLISLITDHENIGNCSHGKLMGYCMENVTSTM